MQTDPHGDAAPPRLPSSSSGVHAAIKKTPAPVLASDALREDLAPLEPGRRASRLWDAGVAAGFLVIGLCLKLGMGQSGAFPHAASVCLTAAVATVATAVVPFPYAWRAIVGAIVGLMVAALGVEGKGPLALLVEPGISTPFSESCRIVAAIAIPAALLFRTHYRAYAKGRWLLAGAIALACPFLAHQAVVVVTGVELIARIGAGIGLCAVLCALFGFLAAPTTAVTAWWAGLVTGAMALDLGLRELYLLPALSAPSAHPPGTFAHVLTAGAFIVAVSPIALGLFQVLACAYARDARQVNVHQSIG